jgi:hypothetical protein
MGRLAARQKAKNVGPLILRERKKIKKGCSAQACDYNAKASNL